MSNLFFIFSHCLFFTTHILTQPAIFKMISVLDYSTLPGKEKGIPLDLPGKYRILYHYHHHCHYHYLCLCHWHYLCHYLRDWNYLPALHYPNPIFLQSSIYFIYCPVLCCALLCCTILHYTAFYRPVLRLSAPSHFILPYMNDLHLSLSLFLSLLLVSQR